LASNAGGLLLAASHGHLALVRPEGSPPKQLQESLVRKWLGDLNDDSFEVRWPAFESLVALGMQVLPWLDQAPEKDEPEVFSSLMRIRELVLLAQLPRRGVRLLCLEKEENIQVVALSPNGERWVALAMAKDDGSGHPELVFGAVTDDGLEAIQRLDVPHGSPHLLFGPDSKTFFMSDQNTVRIYGFEP